MEDEPVFDRQAALELVDGHLTMLVELAETFLAHYTQLTSPISDAVKQRNANTLGCAAHDLKGTLGYFCAESTFQAATNLEKLAGEGNWEGIDQAYQTLQRRLDRLVLALRQLVDDRPDV